MKEKSKYTWRIQRSYKYGGIRHPQRPSNVGTQPGASMRICLGNFIFRSRSRSSSRRRRSRSQRKEKEGRKKEGSRERREQEEQGPSLYTPNSRSPAPAAKYYNIINNDVT